MKIDGKTVILKTNKRFFDVEESGEKPYTVRLMDPDEFFALDKSGVDRIRIEHPEDPKIFYFVRKLRSVYSLGGILGQALVGIAWIHEEDKELPEQ